MSRPNFTLSLRPVGCLSLAETAGSEVVRWHINVINTWSLGETRSKCTYLRNPFLHKEFDEANYEFTRKRVCHWHFLSSRFHQFRILVSKIFWSLHSINKTTCEGIKKCSEFPSDESKNISIHYAILSNLWDRRFLCAEKKLRNSYFFFQFRISHFYFILYLKMAT